MDLDYVQGQSCSFRLITSLAPTVRLSQKDFTLGRDGLPLATQPLGATPNGTSGLLSTWFCSHGPHTSLLPCPHYSSFTHFSCSLFSCVYACTCLCMFTCKLMRGTCASVLYACMRRPKVAVSGNFFSSFPFYSFDHFSTLLFWGRAFFSSVYFTPQLQPSPTTPPPSPSFPFPSSLNAFHFLLQPFKSKSTMDVNKTWHVKL